MSDQRPHLLILAGKISQQLPIARALGEYCQVDVVASIDQVMGALRRETYHAVFADVGDFLPIERALVGEKSSLVLNTIGEGVCIIDTNGRCPWSNKRMRSFAPEVFEKVKQICLQAQSIFALKRGGYRSKKFSIEMQNRYYELITSPVLDARGQVQQVVAVVWDATVGRRLQRKIDAIDAAGRELTRLESEAISRSSPGQRLTLMRDKIIKYSKDLMDFDHFAIRLLDKRNNKLEVVIADGLPDEALEVDLYAQPDGNGICGYVAAAERSYICHDTEKDPRYVPGMDHCKSSLTVPLMLYDEVIGVYNIESDSVGTFTEDDRQFAEIFGRYVGLALHILDLLVVERITTSGDLAESVVEDMAQPLNDIVTEAQTLIEEYIGDDTMRGRLHKIIENVEMLRKTTREVAAGPKAVRGTEQICQQADSLLDAKRVLVADDEQNIRDTIADILTKLGCVCEKAKDGYEAITLIEQQEFDLVISDIKMPYRNGYEIFAATRRSREDVPVLLMTGFGYDPDHAIVRASEEGLSTVLFKPFKVEQLLLEVRKAIGATNTEDKHPRPRTRHI